MTRYLIDGHNLIGAGVIPGISMEQEDDEVRLVQWLRVRQPRLRKPMLVIFDKGAPGETSRSLSGGGVSVRFAPASSSADRVILSLVKAESNPENVIVVSNDAELRNLVRGVGAQLMRVGAFLSLLKSPARVASSREDAFKERPRLSQREIDEYLEMFAGREDDG